VDWPDALNPSTSTGCSDAGLEQEGTVVSWSLTSLFSTNMAISETRGNSKHAA